MRFKNTTGYILPIGRGKVGPYGITPEISKKELETNEELQSRIDNGLLVEHTGPAPEAPTVRAPEVKFDRDPEFPSAPAKVMKPGAAGRKPVEYVVADPDGVDAVSMDSGDSITSFGKEARKSADYIEEGVDARPYMNGADAMEAALNREFEDAVTDDPEMSADGSSSDPDPIDADAAIAADASEFVRTQGKNGGEVTTAKAMIESEISAGMAKVNKTASPMLDNGEASGTGKVAELLKKDFNAKKFMIAKETDATFLKQVGAHTGSDNVRQLIQQRLEELNK